MRTLSLFLVLTGIVGSAKATTITYNTFGDLQAVSTLSFSDNFQSYATGSTASFGTQGITFTQIERGSLDVSIPADIENTTKCATNCLTVDGNEDIRIQLTNGSLFTAIGFDMLTNNNIAPSVELFDASGFRIAIPSITRGPNTLGFFGITSDIPISFIRVESVGGDLQDTAIDNVVIGNVGVSGAPEPAVGLFGTAGMLVMLVAMRRRGVGSSNCDFGSLRR